MFNEFFITNTDRDHYSLGEHVFLKFYCFWIGAISSICQFLLRWGQMRMRDRCRVWGVSQVLPISVRTNLLKETQHRRINKRQRDGWIKGFDILTDSRVFKTSAPVKNRLRDCDNMSVSPKVCHIQTHSYTQNISVFCSTVKKQNKSIMVSFRSGYHSYNNGSVYIRGGGSKKEITKVLASKYA